MKEITKDEALKKYGDVVVTFSSYYKYTFSFVGESEGLSICCEYGGYADLIYRYSVLNNQSCAIKEIDFCRLSVFKDSEVIEEFSE